MNPATPRGANLPTTPTLIVASLVKGILKSRQDLSLGVLRKFTVAAEEFRVMLDKRINNRRFDSRSAKKALISH